MTQKFLVELQDKTKVDFLQQFGEVLHVAKLTGMVVLQTSTATESEIRKHPNVKDIRPSGTFSLAR